MCWMEVLTLLRPLLVHPLISPLISPGISGYADTCSQKVNGISNLHHRSCNYLCCCLLIFLKQCIWLILTACEAGDLRSLLRLFTGTSNLLFEKYKSFVFIYFKKVPRNSRHGPMHSLVGCYSNIEQNYSPPHYKSVIKTKEKTEQAHMEHKEATSVYDKYLL